MKRYCQTNEAELIDAHFLQHPPKNNVAVELGAGDGEALSNTRHLLLQGWRGILVDADPRGATDVHQCFLTLDNVVPTLQALACPPEPALLSIDLDGNDYWLLDLLLNHYKPELVVCEFNPNHSPDAVAIEYNPSHRWDDTDYYGATPEAYVKMLATHGYVLQAVNQCNLFFAACGSPVPLPGPVRHWPEDPLKRKWVTV